MLWLKPESSQCRRRQPQYRKHPPLLRLGSGTKLFHSFATILPRHQDMLAILLLIIVFCETLLYLASNLLTHQVFLAIVSVWSLFFPCTSVNEDHAPCTLWLEKCMSKWTSLVHFSFSSLYLVLLFFSKAQVGGERKIFFFGAQKPRTSSE